MRAGLVFLALSAGLANFSMGQNVGDKVPFVPARLKGALSVEEALQQRRSVRTFPDASLALEDVAQNVYLQVTALGLGTVLVGAFDDVKSREVLGLPVQHTLLGLMPLGRRR